MKHETEIKEALVHLGEDGHEIWKEQYVTSKYSTWFFKPIDIPLINGEGPCSYAECNDLVYEVWDVFCNTIAQFVLMSDAIRYSMELNEELVNYSK